MSLVSHDILLVLALLLPVSLLFQAYKRRGNLFSPFAVTLGVLPLLKKRGPGLKVGKHSLPRLFFSQLHTWFPQASIDSSATVLMESKQISASPPYWSLHCLFNLSTDRICWARVWGELSDKIEKGIPTYFIREKKLLHTNRKISPASTNIQPVFTLVEECGAEWEQGSRGRRCSPIYSADSVFLRWTSGCRIVGDSPARHSTLWAAMGILCRRVGESANEPVSGWLGLRVQVRTHFNSWLYGSSCAIINSSSGESGGGGQTLCHPVGEHPCQFQCLKFMMKCTWSDRFDRAAAKYAAVDITQTSFRDCSKSQGWHVWLCALTSCLCSISAQLHL